MDDRIVKQQTVMNTSLIKRQKARHSGTDDAEGRRDQKRVEPCIILRLGSAPYATGFRQEVSPSVIVKCVADLQRHPWYHKHEESGSGESSD